MRNRIEKLYNWVSGNKEIVVAVVFILCTIGVLAVWERNRNAEKPATPATEVKVEAPKAEEAPEIAAPEPLPDSSDKFRVETPRFKIEVGP